VIIDVPNGAVVADELIRRGVIVDYRPGAGIRVAPHFYTRDEEVESAVAAIDEILARDEWKRYSHEGGVVT
jgi:kynureninase